MPFHRNPRCYAALTNAIPEAIIQPCPHPTTLNAAKLIKIPRSFKTFLKKLNGSALTKDPKSITTAHSLTAFTHNESLTMILDYGYRLAFVG